MNYYEHHLGDYAEATSHLTFVEDAAYSRLMRKVYATEMPLPADVKAVQRLVGARSKEERDSVVVVLEEFFVLGDDGWHNTRCDIEITAYQKKVAHNRSVGKLGGRPKKSKTHPVTKQEPNNNPVGFEIEPEHNPPQSPDSNPQYSEDKSSGDKPPMTPTEIAYTYGLPILVNADTPEKQARSFLGKMLRQDEDKLVAVLRECIRAKPMQPLEWIAKAMLPDAEGPTETRYQKSKREQMARDFPNLMKPMETNHAITTDLG